MSAPLTPGWYGKLPALGDFAGRRLPQRFLHGLDRWLQSALAASRAQLGVRWLDIYLTSPLWRFALLPGAATDDAWAGVMIPSVDKVGRYFPFLVAVALPAHPGVAGRILGARDWFDRIAAIALAALGETATVDAIDAALVATAFPRMSQVACDLSEWWAAPDGTPFSAHLEGTPALESIVAGAALHGPPRATVWWSHADDPAATRLLCFDGLPPADAYVRLLTAWGEP